MSEYQRSVLRNYGIEPTTAPSESVIDIVDPRVPLNNRERQAMELYATLGTQKAVAAAMGVSLQTAKNYFGAVYQKLDVTTAIDAFRELGWLVVPDGIPEGEEPVPLTEASSWSIRIR